MGHNNAYFLVCQYRKHLTLIVCTEKWLPCALMHSQLGLMDREGLLFRTTYTYRQQTPRDMHTRQRTGHEEFIFYTGEGHCYRMLMGWSAITLWHRGSRKTSASSSPAFRIPSRFCVRHSALSNLVASGPLRSLSSLFEPSYPSVKSWVQMLETVMPLGPGCQRGSE